jgi:Caspase domain/WD domain, G-beta repeat
VNPQWIDPARSRVVLVGVPFYADGSLKDFGVIERNVVDLLAVLTDPSTGGLDPSHCTQTEPRASMADIGTLLGRAADEATDLLLFYYCGHGLIGGMRDRQLYLSVYHTDKGREAYTALPFEAVRQDFLRSRAARRVVILDCCFSGRIVGGTLSPADQEIAAQVQIDNSYILASAPGDHPALVLDGEPHTAFTHRFLEILKEGKPGPGEALTLADIYELLESRLIAAGLPRMQALATGGADRLPLVRNRAYAPETGQDHADGSAGLLLEQSLPVGGGRGWPLWRRALVVAGCAAAAAGITFPIILSQPGVSADRPGAAHPGQPEASGQPQSPSPYAALTDPVAYGGGDVQGVAFSPDGKMVATGDGNGSTYLWDVASPGHPAATLTAPATAGDVQGVAFSPDGTMVAIGEMDNGSTYLWDVASPGHPVATLTDPRFSSVRGVAFSPDGKMVATADVSGSAYLWRLGAQS